MSLYPLILLCGGAGTRLGNLTKDKQKCMIPISDKPFLSYQLDYFEQKGIKEVILSIGYFSEQIEYFIENHYSGSISISLSYDGENQLGTGGAVKKATQNINTPFFVMYGDSFLNISFTDVQSKYILNNGPLMVIYENNNSYDESNVFYNGNYINYNKSSPMISSKHIDYGIGIYEYSYFNNFEDCFDLASIQEKFSNLKQLQSYEVFERFYEIGSHSGLEEFKNFIKYHEKDKLI